MYSLKKPPGTRCGNAPSSGAEGWNERSKRKSASCYCRGKRASPISVIVSHLVCSKGQIRPKPTESTADAGESSDFCLPCDFPDTYRNAPSTGRIQGKDTHWWRSFVFVTSLDKRHSNWLQRGLPKGAEAAHLLCTKHKDFLWRKRCLAKSPSLQKFHSKKQCPICSILGRCV